MRASKPLQLSSTLIFVYFSYVAAINGSVWCIFFKDTYSWFIEGQEDIMYDSKHLDCPLTSPPPTKKQ
jgi:hypothetical protein